jgi:hypothetical protein
MSASILDLCTKITSLIFEDPVYVAMSKGEIRWGDLLTRDEKYMIPIESSFTPSAPKGKVECPDAPPCRKVSWADERYDSDESESDSDEEDEVHYGPIVFFKPEDDDMPWLDKTDADMKEESYIPVRRTLFKPSFVGGAKPPAPFPAGRKTIMAKNLPRETITVAKLRMVFEPFGTVKDVYIPKNYYDGTIKGFAKIEFLSADAAAAAYDKLFGSLTIDGNFIGLEPANADRTY